MPEQNDAERQEEEAAGNAAAVERAADDNIANGATEHSAAAAAAPEAGPEAGINLLEALMTAQQEAAEFRDGWQRERADYANYRKRNERALSDSRQQAATEIFRRLLPILDDLERAFQNIPQQYNDEPWREGLALILRNADKFLADHEIAILDPVGDEFDPNMHEAIGMEEDSEFASNTVTETLQKGYTLQGRILRPALVRVAK